MPYRTIANEIHVAEKHAEDAELRELSRASLMRKVRVLSVCGVLLAGVFAIEIFAATRPAEVAQLRCHDIQMVYENARHIPASSWTACHWTR